MHQVPVTIIITAVYVLHTILFNNTLIGNMSLLNWLLKQPPKHNFLPDPRNIDLSLKDATAFAAANQEVSKTIVKMNVKSRGSYKNYTPQLRAEIGQFATENGNAKAVKFAQKKFNLCINESSIRFMKKAYLQLQQVTPGKKIDAVPRKPTGRPLMLGKDLDTLILKYIRATRDAGGIVNKNIVISAAMGIISHFNKSLLKQNGGHIEITRTYAASALKRLGYVQRKGTKSARKVPDNFEEIKMEFHKLVYETAVSEAIPPELIINWDQTGLKIIPVNTWTMAQEGSKQVEIIGLEDKREITALLAISMAGDMLPSQLIYSGKTDACHPKINFPKEWDIFHTLNHWSNEVSMVRYVEKILIPYIENIKIKLGLPKEQRAMAIFDVFAAHRTQSLRDKLDEAGIIAIFIPAGCTGELQPLDLTINEAVKRQMKEKFSAWYGDKIQSELAKDKDITTIKIGLQLSILKPLHANWVIQTFDDVGKKSGLIKKGFEKAGIYNYSTTNIESQ